VAGINVAVPVSVSGGGARWSKNGGAYTAAAGTVVAGDQVRLQLTAPNTLSRTKECPLPLTDSETVLKIRHQS